MEIMGTDVSDTVFIGDQLFTDVWGAKRTGIPSILVRPIHPKEEIQIVLKRYLENIVLHFYKKSLEKVKKVEKAVNYYKMVKVNKNDHVTGGKARFKEDYNGFSR